MQYRVKFWMTKPWVAVGVGQVFGEAALLLSGTRTTDVVALENVRLAMARLANVSLKLRITSRA
jgi:hypothetical protein